MFPVWGRQESPIAIELLSGDFFDCKNGLSQGKTSKESRPLLEEVSVVQFRVGEACMYFKRSFEEDYKCADFLMKRLKNLVAEKRIFTSQVVKERPTIDSARNQGIIDKLCPFMPADRKEFWYNLWTLMSLPRYLGQVYFWLRDVSRLSVGKMSKLENAESIGTWF